jgi:hypothetical protein
MGAPNQRAKWSNPNISTSVPPTWEQQVRSLFVTSYMRDNQIQDRGVAARLLRESVARRNGFNLRALEAASWNGLKLPPGAARFLQCWCPGCSIGNNRFTITWRPRGGGPPRYPGCYFPIPFDGQGMDSPAASPWGLDADELIKRLERLVDGQRVQKPHQVRSYAAPPTPPTSSELSFLEQRYGWEEKQKKKGKKTQPRPIIPREYEKNYIGKSTNANANVNGSSKGKGNSVHDSNSKIGNGQSWTQTGQELSSIPSYPIVNIPKKFPEVNVNVISALKGNSTHDSDSENENRQSWTQTREQLDFPSFYSNVYIPIRFRVRIPTHHYLTAEYQAQFANFDYSSLEESKGNEDDHYDGDNEPTEPFPAYVESPEKLEEIEKENGNGNGNGTNTQQRTYAEVLRMNNNTSSSATTNSNMEPKEQEMQVHASRFGAWGMNSSSTRQSATRSSGVKPFLGALKKTAAKLEFRC